MEIEVIPFEYYAHLATMITSPVDAFSFYIDDEHGAGRDVWMVYESDNVELLEAA